MASRFRLTSDMTSPDISPATQSYTHNQGLRRILKLTDTSTLTTEDYFPDAVDDLDNGDALHIQFVSNPLNAGAVFTSGDTIKWCLQGTETHSANNLRVQIFASVVSEDGATVRATIRSKGSDDIELPGALQSRFHSATLDGSYTLVAGDRIVVEYSVVGDPTASGGVQGHNASLRWGSGGAGGDLLESDGQTGTTLDPWIEFATTVTEAGGGTQDLTGTLFSKAPTFNAGAVTSTYALAGTLFTNTPTFNAGAIASSYALSGVLFQSTPTFNAGAVVLVDQFLTGTLFTNTPTFFAGAVATDAVDLAGTLFVNTPTFFAGAVAPGAVNLAGVLFANAPTFFQGDVEAEPEIQTLTGELFQNVPTFNAGAVASSYALTGTLFTNTPSFNAGVLSIFPGGIPVTKVVAWYAARFTAGVDNTTIATIPDLADNGANDLQQNNASNRALWLDDIVNGLPTFRFGGNHWYRAAWNQTIAEPYQVFIVLNTRTPFGLDDDEVYFSGFTADASDKHLFAIVDHTLPVVNTPDPAVPPWWMIEQAGNDQHVVGGTPVDNTWYVVRTDFESTDLITIDGVPSTAEGDAGSLSSIGITFGARENFTRGTTGDIAELIFTQDLTADEKAAVEDELLAIYGIATQEQFLAGTLFTKAPTFFAGAITTGAVDLAGTLFVHTPLFSSGVLQQEGGPQPLGGVLFQLAPTFPQGAVTTGAVDVAGVLFTATPTFFTGAVTSTYDLAGVLFENTPTFPQGEVVGAQLLTGVLFQNTPVFFEGSMGTGTLDGTLFVSTPVFFVGSLTQSDRVFPFWPVSTLDGWPVSTQPEWQGV